MKSVNEIKELINTYDEMIENLVELNAPDKVIGSLELKRQKLINECKKAEGNNTSTIVEVGEVQATCQNVQKSGYIKCEYVQKGEPINPINSLIAERVGLVDKIMTVKDVKRLIEIDNILK